MKCYSFLLKSPPPSPASSFTKLNTASRSSPWPRTEWRQNKQQHQQRSLCPIIAPSQVATSSSHACRFESASRQWFAHRHRWPSCPTETTYSSSFYRRRSLVCYVTAAFLILHDCKWYNDTRTIECDIYSLSFLVTHQLLALFRFVDPPLNVGEFANVDQIYHHFSPSNWGVQQLTASLNLPSNLPFRFSLI